MNKYFFIVVSLFLFSCTKNLDEKVYSKLSPSNFYTNASDAESALYGVYNSLNHPGANGDWNTHLYSMVFMPSKYVIGRVTWRRLYSNFTYGTSENALTTVWRLAYITINRANAVIDNVPAIDMDTASKKRVIAEAKFLRALTYFNLVRLYGGVPLRVKETTGLAGVDMPRSKATDVYDLIITDLKEAEENLPDKRPASQTGRATNGAASGLLGRVYLTMSGHPLLQSDKWALAKDKFKYIIDNRARWGYDLLPNFADVFSLDHENSSEVLFAIQNSHETGQGTVLPFFSAPLNSTFATAMGQYHYGFTTTFRNLFAPDDILRRDVTVVYSYVEKNGKKNTYNVANNRQYMDPNGMALGKFKDGTGGAATNSSHANDVIVLRYADILLMFAEAENEVNGPTVDALDAINEVRARAKAKPIASGISQAEFRDTIHRERLLELSGELTMFFDIQRWGTLEENMNNSPDVKTAGTSYDPKFYLYPIPQQEMDVNTKITQADQNPGW